MKDKTFWLDFFDACVTGLQWGALLALLTLALFAASELAAYTQATYALVREMRSDIRSRLPVTAEKGDPE